MSEPLKLSRRGLFGLAGVGLAGVGLGVGGDRVASSLGAATDASAIRYEFYGTHQAGITTPAQDRLHFAAFDVAPNLTRAELIELLQDWTVAAAAMTLGKELGQFGAGTENYDAPPEDTGEAVGLPVAGLTLTFGFGPSLFSTAGGSDRFGLLARKPAELVDLPHFAGDDLDAIYTGGDLCIQACANDPQVAVHAIRNLTRLSFGRAALKWSQLGFGRTSSTSASQTTERNLFGFKDGTANIKSENTADVASYVWADSNGSAQWMMGGSYLVARRIRMTLETWDRASLREQERVVGRDKAEGGPLSGGKEFTAVDFTVKNSDGMNAIDANSHVARSHPSHNSGVQLLRRGYNFVDGNDALGRLNAGLFFISFQKSPEQFITIQRNLAKNDAMGEYLKHVGSGVFAIPPGVHPGSFIGSSLFLA